MAKRRSPQPEQDIQILIVGSGAMACLFAARLSAAGIPIAMLGSWKEGVNAIRQFGVRIIDSDSNLRTFPVQIFSDHSILKDIPYAIALVKSWQTERTAAQLIDCLAYDGLLLTLQNGIGNQELYEKHLGEQRVCVGVTTLGATQIKPGMVEPAGEGPIFVGQHPRLARLLKYLSQAQFQLEITENAQSLLWGKLVINAAINPLTALLRIPNGELLERPDARTLLRSAAQETASVAASLGIDLPYPDPIAAVEDTAYRTAPNFSSMLQDVQRGTPTEIDAICGAVVRAGETAGIPTPINRTFWHLIQALHPPQASSDLILEGNNLP
jgi:2-dehydropantoate 2-reductase